MPAAPTVTHDAVAGQFKAPTAHGPATLKYLARGDVMDLVHTVVPQEAQGRGIGTALAHAALAYARREGKQVIPSCPFVLSYLQRHKEFANLVAPT